ncbi:MAG: hypothetical protein CR954_00910 [Candidatus Moraniibacteriota bacterium]|nr:MAG: hypothetical protein CR954_00910 [Candidatus Moranbacteria bacterium]
MRDNGGVLSTGEISARQELAQRSGGKIHITHTPTGYTRVGGLRKETMDGVVNFQKESGVVVKIVGGSENIVHSKRGKYTHANGYKVDIEDTPEVNNFIESHYEKLDISQFARKDITAAYSDGKGNIYYREATHWDVCYQCKG